MPSYLYFKIFNKTSNYILNSFYDLNYHDVELFHFFNTLSYGNKAWITTFETFLPRWNNSDPKTMKAGLKLISKDSCKKIIAISECTKNIQMSLTDKIAPEYNDVINEKLIVLHPSQVIPKDITFHKNKSGRINFTIIGHDFFRKGGKEVLIVFDRLYKEGLVNWHLNIISKLEFGDYASKTTIEDYKSAKKIINELSGNISYHKILPNSEVMNILKNTHVGLLPTYADTYGYSVLEAQSFGCPVITTNIRAMPEINNWKKVG